MICHNGRLSTPFGPFTDLMRGAPKPKASSGKQVIHPCMPKPCRPNFWLIARNRQDPTPSEMSLLPSTFGVGNSHQSNLPTCMNANTCGFQKAAMNLRQPVSCNGSNFTAVKTLHRMARLPGKWSQYGATLELPWLRFENSLLRTL